MQEVGLCGDDSKSRELIDDINRKKNDKGQSFDELRDLDRDATKKGYRVGVRIVDDGGGSQYTEDDTKGARGYESNPGKGSGGTITIDIGDTKKANLTMITEENARSKRVDRTFLEAPTLESILIHESKHARDGVHGLLDEQTKVNFAGITTPKSEVRAIQSENRWRRFLGIGKYRVQY